MKTRVERERELLRLSQTKDGCGAIVDLFKKVKGIDPGLDTPEVLGPFVQQDMIPAILAAEYPNG